MPVSLPDGVGIDFIQGDRMGGSVAALLAQHDFNVGALRPYVEEDGRTYITLNKNGQEEAVPVSNTTYAFPFRKDDWLTIDRAIIKTAKPRLKAFGDLRAAGNEYNIPNGMGKLALQHEAVSDISQATISMDGLRKSQADRPVFDLRNLPLPIIHKDFHFSARQLAVSRNGGSPLDTTNAELAARRVAEVCEELTLGTLAAYAFGGGTIYGYTNFPQRLTHVTTDPTAGGWTPATTVADILHMKLMCTQNFYYGPWMLYTSLPWEEYLDADYKTTSSVSIMTLRERLQKISGIVDVRPLDYLTGYRMILVQQTQDVARAVIGMDLTTVQWPSEGGLMVNFKVMAIMVPQLRYDYYGNTGIVDGASTLSESPSSAPTVAQIMAR